MSLFISKVLAGLLMVTAFSAMAADVPALAPTGTYHLFLYFGNTKPFEDDLILKVSANGVEGVMHVPNDFDAPIEKPILSSDGRLSFHVTLPHKYDAAFPHGLDYVLQFESPRASGTNLNFNRFVGFVEQPIAKSYVGSVVGFKQE